MAINSKISVGVLNGTEETLKDPILGRPFSFNLDRIEYTESYSKADYILGYLDYLECERDFYRIKMSDTFKKYQEKFVFWSMHDTPLFAYQENKSLKFICQPLSNPKVNNANNVIPVPLQMRHYELEMIKDLDFIEQCRRQEKINDYVYVGQIVYANRYWLRNINLPNYDFKETTPIWGIKETSKRIQLNKDFCKRISKSKFCFAPRGIGSSSFRLYQSMMVGTVPIVSGMLDYPFKEEVQWSDFCIVNKLDNHYPFNTIPVGLEYDAMRSKAIKFWDEYVRIENCDRKLFEKYLIG